MKNELILFSTQQGNLLIRILLAHIFSDFVLQSNKMVQNKRWFSPYMLLHIIIVFITTLVLSGLWKISLFIAVLHWLADAIKSQLQTRNRIKENTLFIADQLFHLLIIIAVWFWHFDLFQKLFATIYAPFLHYKYSLILLAYIWLYFPAGYFIKFATQNMSHTNPPNAGTTIAPQQDVEHGGKLIGQFERIIILTLVLLNQYEAIGFLITGKSIIRFADHNSNLRSEYVLVGTMMSYALAILTGVIANHLLSSI